MTEPSAPSPEAAQGPPPVVAPEPQAQAPAQKGVWERLKQHKVAEWTLAYTAAAYTLLHATEMVSEAMEWPHVVARILTLVLALGFPVVITLAWYHGAKGVKRFSAPELTIITILLVLAGSVLWALNRTRAEHAPAAEVERAAPASAVAAAAIPEQSIAVLPFVNMSEDKNNEYFSDGLSEELIDLLTKVPGLHIPARTSSFYFKGKQVTIAEIAHALGVAHVLEGSVRKSGNTLRITAQLIRVDTGYHMWSETFDRQLTDVFKVQDEIASAVVQALKASLLGGTAPKAQLTTNPEAYNLYLQARSIAGGGTTGDFNSAIHYLRQAVALDDKFAAAWATLASMLIADLNFHSATPSSEACPRAHQAADKALQIEPMSPRGHEAKGDVLMACDWDWKAAEAQLRRALELDPMNTGALKSYSQLAWYLNRPAQAVQLAQEAVVRDPLNAGSYVSLAIAQGASGDLAAAEASFRRAAALNPEGAGPHALLAHVLLAEHKFAEALQETQREPDEEFRHDTFPLVFDALGRRSDADRELAILIDKYPDGEALSIAEVYACRGNLDEALNWLERNVAEHLLTIDVPPGDACIRRLQGNPRYQALLRTMGLPG